MCSLLLLITGYLPGQALVSDPNPLEICDGEGFEIFYQRPTTGCNAPAIWEFSPDNGMSWISVGNNMENYIVDGDTLIGVNIPSEFLGVRFRVRAGSCTSEVLILTVNESPSSVTITATPGGPLCPGTEIVLSVNNGNEGVIDWFEGSASTSFARGASVPFTPSVTETYRAVRTISGVCPAEGEVTVVVLEEPSPVTSVTSNITAPCLGQEITLRAIGGSDNAGTIIRWYSQPNGGGGVIGTGTPFRTPAATQTYYARRESLEECSEFTYMDASIPVTTTTPPIAMIAAVPENSCIDTPIEFVATSQSGSVNYAWEFSGGNPEEAETEGPHAVSFGATGLRAVKLRVTEGSCIIEDNVTINIVDKPDILVNDQLLQENTEITIVEQFSSQLIFSSAFPDVAFSWEATLEEGRLMNNPGAGSGTTYDERFTLAEGTEEARVRLSITAAADECNDTRDLFIRITKLMQIPNLISVNGDGFNECWNIELFGGMFSGNEFEVKLYDRSGNCVMGCSEDFLLSQAMDWCGEGCAAGAYWYTIEGPEGFQKTGSVTLVK